MEPLSRRTFLRLSAVAAAAVPAASLLAACAEETPQPLPPDLLPLPPAGAPLPLNGISAVAPGPLEDGPLRIYQWKSYLYDEILETFSKRYDVDLVVRNYEDIDEALAGIRSGKMQDFDVFFPTIPVLGKLAAFDLIRPLTHELLPNMANLWDFFRTPDGPFYDVGQRYTVPYTIYGTGIAWRKDMLHRNDWPTSLDNPYESFWLAKGPGVGFYDAYREALAMALLRNGVEDVNTGDAAALAAAADALVELGEVGVTRGDDGAYEGIPLGTFSLHQSWSGDLLSASSGKRYADAADDIGFLWPQGGVVGADLTAVLANGRNPRLAHAFVDFLMEPEIAWTNYTWNGYQPPVTMPSGSEAKWAPPVPTVTMQPEDLDTGKWLLELPPEADAVWRQAWQRVTAVTERQAED